MFPNLSLSPLWDRLRCLTDLTPNQGRLPPEQDGEPLERLRAGVEALGLRLIDLRGEPRTGRGEARGTRRPEKCTALWWHQTASIVSLRQALGIPVHCLILPGSVVLLHPWQAYLWHAGGANSFSIGIEICCRAAGIEGDLRTLWRSKREINGYTDRRGEWHPPRSAAELVQEAADKQLAAGRLVGAYYVEVAPIVASGYHRNSEKSRVSDPGSRIAQGVGYPVAQEHGLEHGGPIVGSGRATPQIWHGVRGEAYNWRVKGW